MSDKHKKNITESLTEQEIEDTLENVKDMLLNLEPKQQHIMAEWLKVWKIYLKYENSFIPAKLKYYKRGEIVLAHFGYNTGSELGGTHYAVIVENNNNKANSNVVVVPLSSLESGKSPDDLHKSEVYLGNILPGTNKNSYAMPLQIRAISKLRIIKPKNNKDGVYMITNSQLDEIDNKIKQLYTYN